MYTTNRTVITDHVNLRSLRYDASQRHVPIIISRPSLPDAFLLLITPFSHSVSFSHYLPFLTFFLLLPKRSKVNEE
uniref:Uncharacterized protein n=1 Tax=Caenorhabditis japonica TaxID=281687 RepID=A0A8R1IRU9_CAEJA